MWLLWDCYFRRSLWVDSRRTSQTRATLATAPRCYSVERRSLRAEKVVQDSVWTRSRNRQSCVTFDDTDRHISSCLPSLLPVPKVTMISADLRCFLLPRQHRWSAECRRSCIDESDAPRHLLAIANHFIDGHPVPRPSAHLYRQQLFQHPHPHSTLSPHYILIAKELPSTIWHCENSSMTSSMTPHHDDRRSFASPTRRRSTATSAEATTTTNRRTDGRAGLAGGRTDGRADGEQTNGRTNGDARQLLLRALAGTAFRATAKAKDSSVFTKRRNEEKNDDDDDDDDDDG